ncbi:alpha/beta hydrolase [Streptomyces tuirus]|uniref:Alpha/beta hydrolase n=1 Tax=Streptomyces tuirus TaxID=68278 RepID=A0A941F9T9_9ACTN|nr:alpha/beta hydrolase [Streptomyces tuirus]
MSGIGLTFTTSDGVRIVYDDLGSGRPVVLVHGYSVERGFWDLQKDTLVDAGYRVIAIDQRNHGDSDRTEFGQRMSRHGQDLKELIDSLALNDIALVGHSMGVSVCLAMFSLHGTAGVSKFVAIDQSPKMVNDGDWTYGSGKITWDNLVGCLTGETKWFDPELEPTGPESADELLKRSGQLRLSFPHAHNRRLLLDHWVADWRDVLPKIKVPSWVVTAKYTPYHSVEGMQWFADQLGGTLTVFEKSGHSPQVNESAAFNQALLAFLAS